MRQLQHFGIRTDNKSKSKELTKKDYQQIYEWEKEDDKLYGDKCEDCLKNKKIPGYDLCYTCAKKNRRTQ